MVGSGRKAEGGAYCKDVSRVRSQMFQRKLFSFCSPNSRIPSVSLLAIGMVVCCVRQERGSSDSVGSESHSGLLQLHGVREGEVEEIGERWRQVSRLRGSTSGLSN